MSSPPRQTRGGGGTWRRSKYNHLHPQQDVICQVKANNVSKIYLRKSQRKIQDQGFYFVFLSSNHREYLEELETTFCGEFHRNWKISGKIRTNKNRNSRDLRDHQIQPCHSDTEKNSQRESRSWMAVILGWEPTSADSKNNFLVLNPC